jgi:hypothetical protein
VHFRQSSPLIFLMSGVAAGTAVILLAAPATSAPVPVRPLAATDCPSGQLNVGEPTYLDDSVGDADPDVTVAQWASTKGKSASARPQKISTKLSTANERVFEVSEAGQVKRQLVMTKPASKGWFIETIRECAE